MKQLNVLILLTLIPVLILHSVSFAEITEQIKAHYKRGGVITISWLADNPLTRQITDIRTKHQGGTACN